MGETIKWIEPRKECAAVSLRPIGSSRRCFRTMLMMSDERLHRAAVISNNSISNLYGCAIVSVVSATVHWVHTMNAIRGV